MFVVLNVVFRVGFVVDLAVDAFVAVGLCLVQVDGEDDLVEWFVDVGTVVFQELICEFDDVLLWYGVEEADEVVI